jgi:ectoine hydroxylase-related dioxygenase (phytanoyl-CoA dioxygenase family)
MKLGKVICSLRLCACALLLVLGAASAPAAAQLHARLLRNGFARLPAALPAAEAAAFRAPLLRAVAAEAARCGRCSARELQDVEHAVCFGCDHAFREAAPARSFARARRLEENDPALAALVRHPALARAAGDAMNVSGVRLYQATAFVKRAGDAPSAWHQDSAAAPFDSDRVVTLWLALADVPRQCGPLRFVRGSHLPGVPVPSLRNVALTKRLRAMRAWSDADVTAGGLDIVEPPEGGLSAGDATLHLGWTLHGAKGNACKEDRPAIALTYFADGARIHRDLLRIDGEGSSVAAVGADGGSSYLASTQEAGEDAGAVRLQTADGKSTLVVRLLADDASTWVPWLRARPPLLVPGMSPRSEALTPLLYSRGDAKRA